MFVVAHNGAHLWGGAERATSLLLAGLQERGHRVLLLCGDARVAEGAGALGVPADLLPLGGDVALPHALRLAGALRRLRPGAFVIGTYKKLCLAALGARLARVPLVVARVGMETDTPRNAKYRFAIPRWVDVVAVNASRVRPAFLALPGFSERRVPVIHNGVRPPVRRGPPGALRAALGIAPGSLVIGAVARLARQKRFDRLIGALSLLPADVHCVLAGDGEERPALEAMACAAGLAPRVHFLGNRDDVGDVLDALDVFVSTSDREGMSSAMLEALAAGVPVVSTPVSGADEALEPFADGAAPGIITGWTEVEVATAVSGLLADALGRRRMGEAALRSARERFDFDTMLDRWEAVLGVRTGKDAALRVSSVDRARKAVLSG